MTLQSFGPDDWAAIARLLAGLGEAVRREVCGSLRPASDSEVVGFEGGDTIFRIDSRADGVIRQALEAWPDRFKPIRLIGEGMEDAPSARIGPGDREPRLALLIDPIDGTRGLMYDKRPAWFIAAAAPAAADPLALSAIRASAMVELPTSKAGAYDLFLHAQGGPVAAERVSLLDGTRQPWQPRPSQARNLDFGFAQVSNFFPGTKVMASELMEAVAAAASGRAREGESLVFDDQYISTAGQLVELLTGHDRFCCDLRPLFNRIRAGGREPAGVGVECHPYDIAGLEIARAAGVILTDGWGRPLDAPFDNSTGIHWCGYANETIRGLVEPVVQGWLASRLPRP